LFRSQRSHLRPLEATAASSCAALGRRSVTYTSRGGLGAVAPSRAGKSVLETE
jgi:hypothetical protein